ncbi:hypothetical protein ILUMI_18172 [Ignelater luminosus]|uniref:Reverse transcriptase Ty1/copia-type domain-containing protein n=1 Tax=Ignelater luminosus TaxID=2038154 RepID=A0A8K0CMM4_IGNLU|nr:hypothetical protein ILUMI_18172 [Ignelater luminosus]
MGNDIKVLDEFVAVLNRMFECTVWEPNQYVGLEIIRDRPNRTIFIYQQSYVSRILKLFNMEDFKSAKVPAELNSFIQKQENNQAGEVPCHEAVGMLMFLAIVSRPDVEFTAAQVSRFLDSPSKEHGTAVQIWSYRLILMLHMLIPKNPSASILLSWLAEQYDGARGSKNASQDLQLKLSM